ncbi:serine/threonine-protein kinase RsbW [Keratinibaculum paraultunense]|uniref:Serine/threonine-protein kinase RsbW n=1 Tax=Keratinibaculum paraultunense TaxID=1278232 RepID=A0A4R3KX92_9FIRM|nr:ATP-binding protein [Keratinibaculum paraultunense]QQY79315.1 ATP-binding protein [Keratinibaculum paraultunense]TCS89450.1 serine/threonine-protein kinase RsbW [Keratinibaculum paraultunense]
MGVIQVYFKYQGSVCSDLDDTKVFIQNILNRLKDVVDDENLLFDLKLILNELVINSVIHGNKCKKEKCVYLYLEILEDTIRIEVSDEGRGIDFDISSYNPRELKCCGRGLILVDGLSDELYIDENRVEVIKYIC